MTRATPLVAILLACASVAACTPVAPGPAAGGTQPPGSVPPATAGPPASSPSVAPTTAAVQAVRDVVYSTVDAGGTPLDLALDLYLATTGAALPVLVFVHGGAWIEGRKEYCPGEQLAAHGYAVACIDYRLARDGCPDWTTFPAAVLDVRAAVAWVRTHAREHGLDADRVVLIGDSAGGHLATLAGLSTGVKALAGEHEDAAPVQGIVDWYGPTDARTGELAFTDDPCTTTVDALVAKYGQDVYATRAWGLFLGGSLADAEVLERAALAAPATHADADDPPVLVIHGEADNVVGIDQSELLVDRLLEVGADVTFVRPPLLEHSYWTQTGAEGVLAPEILQPTLDFLASLPRD